MIQVWGGQLQEANNMNIIMLGDFNGVINPDLDRSNVTTTPPLKKKLYSIHTSIEIIGCVARERNKSEHNYTYYSSRHNSYSCIDMILKISCSETAGRQMTARQQKSLKN